MVKAIVNEAQNLSLFLSNLLFLISELIVVFSIYLLLLFVNWKITFIVTVFLIVNIIILIKVVSPKIKKAGVDRDIHQKNFYELLGALFGNFKIIKLQKSHAERIDSFESATNNYAQVNILHSTLSQVPRLYLEAIAFSLIALIVLMIVYSTQEDISSSLSLITFFLLGLFRLMPSANRILSSYNNMLFYSKAVDIIFEDLNLPEESCLDSTIDFSDYIEVRNLSFKYDKKYILKDINLRISKNEKIAFVGESGSGKSTMVDILMGFYSLKRGDILIDGIRMNPKYCREWRAKIGYIPQNIYLFDGSVASNVAMSQEYDEEEVKKALKQAKILNFLEDNHQGIDTNVGEGGAKLSGGQKQRVAIARALYKNPEILILDEATSALDEKTETEIMKEIYKIAEKKTLIIIAHRLSTIKGCDRVIKFENAGVRVVENS
jgi:ABC-type multidrug transport system fused ATPase/permease subunit